MNGASSFVATRSIRLRAVSAISTGPLRTEVRSDEDEGPQTSLPQRSHVGRAITDARVLSEAHPAGGSHSGQQSDVFRDRSEVVVMGLDRPAERAQRTGHTTSQVAVAEED